MAKVPVKKLDFLNLAPYVRYVQVYNSNEEYKVPPRVIYDHEIVFMLSGKFVHYLDGIRYEQQAGDVFFLRPHVKHSTNIIKGENISYYAVHFDLEYMGEQLDFSAIDVYANVDYQHIDYVPIEEELSERPVIELSEVMFPSLIQAREPLLYIQAFREMHDIFNEKLFGYHLFLRAHLLRILGYMVRDVTTPYGVRKEFSHRTEITEAIQYMYEHYKEELDFNNIPQAKYLSPNYFRSLFKEATGKTPLELLTFLRIEQAKSLMQEGKHSVGDICYSVGYQDIHYFSKLFKKMEGMSPKHYIDSLNVLKS
ncbi:AraC family transcriptional regulator [Paenibacillus psychroresistens]|uniref:AraC family transcriptional regulator n=1 Tax=Paenibacillus psychroresistens TaxID=1778678 RepID=A0A6B8RUP0_9BACL|nr:AraC family transcriptional regulator [Paenibacillus psychroresistens]QGQ99163.1 AraC family transcriptional regulator [Paenibacillus psychroresistens]